MENQDSEKPARRRNKRGEATRETIVSAAVRCVQRSGYAATSIETVIAEAAVGRGSLLHQFPTRVDLMAATAEAAMSRMVSHASDRLTQISTPRDRLFALFDLAWEAHNLPEAVAVTEVLLASRWDEALGTAIRGMVEGVERKIDRLHVRLARDNAMRDVSSFIIYGRLLNSNLRGLTIELMFNANRGMILKALEAERQKHRRLCVEWLTEAADDRTLPRTA